MKSSIRGLMGAAFVLALAAPASAQDAAVVHDSPWGQGGTIDDAADDVFGVGAWSHHGYSGLNAATIFSATNRFVYIDGSDFTENAFYGFVSANRTAMENWVAAGGRLYINAATQAVMAMNLGFGVSSTRNVDPTGTAVDGSHELFDDRGFGDPGTAWTGNYFSHNFLTGAGLESLIVDGLGRTTLGAMAYGSGFVMFGGLTTNNFHTPSPEVQYLTRNILDYTSGAPTEVVPEPITMVLLGSGLVGIGGAARRRRKQDELA